MRGNHHWSDWLIDKLSCSMIMLCWSCLYNLVTAMRKTENKWYYTISSKLDQMLRAECYWKMKFVVLDLFLLFFFFVGKINYLFLDFSFFLYQNILMIWLCWYTRLVMSNEMNFVEFINQHFNTSDDTLSNSFACTCTNYGQWGICQLWLAILSYIPVWTKIYWY